MISKELKNRLGQVDDGNRKNNIIIFGLQRNREESYFEPWIWWSNVWLNQWT
jgi:hypothetical protein